MSDDEARRPAGELWVRSAQLVDVSFPDRTIELIVLPYEQPALVPWEKRMVTETIARGAFDGIERRANRIRVNRDHMLERTVGRAIALHPSREEGLVGQVKIARTPLGDETLELADEGCLDASAGFLPMAGGQRWLSRSAYVITRGWLGHIGLTPEPAHEGARVLAVRAASSGDEPVSATPNLDQWRALIAEDRLRTVIASDSALR
jgi:HK97 family phage prohead protease